MATGFFTVTRPVVCVQSYSPSTTCKPFIGQLYQLLASNNPETKAAKINTECVAKNGVDLVT